MASYMVSSKHKSPQAGTNKGKSLQCNAFLGNTISLSKFKNSEIHVVTYILKKTVFIPYKVSSSKISSKIECFRAKKSKSFLTSNHGGGRVQAVRTIFIYLNLVTTLCCPNSLIASRIFICPPAKPTPHISINTL